MAVEVQSPSALERALSDPACFERWSPLAGAPALVVDAAGLCTPAAGLPDRPRLRLEQLPVVTVGLGAPPGEAPPESLAAALDLTVSDRSQLDPLLDAIRRTPLASLCLVQLLRQTERRSIHEGLLAESWVYSTLQAGPEFRRWLSGRTPRKPRPLAGPAVRAERSGARLRIRLDRPEKRNAFGTEMRDGLCEALLLVLQDDAIEEVWLSGEGPAFCSGGDLDEFGTLPDPATAHAIRCQRHPARLLAACAGRVHAQVHGACVGAGVELPAFCHHVVAVPGAFFQLPEVRMGLVPGAGGTVSLPRRIGRQRTAWLALAGARLDLETARVWGLVDGEGAAP